MLQKKRCSFDQIEGYLVGHLIEFLSRIVKRGTNREMILGHIYIYTCLHIYILTYLHIYIFTYIHIYIYTYIHIYIYTYIHIYTYTHIHIYIYTYMVSCSGFRVPTPPPQWYGSPSSTPFPSICKLLAAFLRSSLVFARSLQQFLTTSLAFTRYMLPFRRPT